MISVNDLSIRFGQRQLFKHVNATFNDSNCYGVIGANGAGKSTFLKVLSGDIEPTTGYVKIDANKRLSKLDQDHGQYDQLTVLDTVISGHQQLTKISKERNELYSKSEFSDEDGLRMGELEEEFAHLGGYEAESDAAALLAELGILDDKHQQLLGAIDEKEKVRVLLAKALFANPDILLLDEPTNGLDEKASRWLEGFLYNFNNLVIVISHDRHFLNKVSTHIVDIDFESINIFVGNYDFWYESSQLIERQMKESNKKAELRVNELKEFIARFSANASKSRQATSRKKELDKIELVDIKPSGRRYPFIDFRFESLGNDILTVTNLSSPYFKNVSFTVNRGDKILFLSSNSVALSTLLFILAGTQEASGGNVKWGITTTRGHLMQGNELFGEDLSLVDWLRQFSKEKNETFIRGWLGRMLFAKEEALKSATVLSGGEKVRMLLAKMMLEGPNCLLMDDPSNHLDLEAITVLNKAMINFRGCLLFTTHDREIASTVANRIIVIDNGVIFDRQVSYEEYLQLTNQGV